MNAAMKRFHDSIQRDERKERKLNEGNRGITWELCQRTCGYSTDDRRGAGRSGSIWRSEERR